MEFVLKNLDQGYVTPPGNVRCKYGYPEFCVDQAWDGEAKPCDFAVCIHCLLQCCFSDAKEIGHNRLASFVDVQLHASASYDIPFQVGDYCDGLGCAKVNSGEVKCFGVKLYHHRRTASTGFSVSYFFSYSLRDEQGDNT